MMSRPTRALAYCILLLASLLALPAQAQDPNAKIRELSDVAHTLPCADLRKVSLEDVGGKDSRVISADTSTQDGRETCTITAALAPSIRFQLTLPADNWNQRYLQVGCGGLCGNITPRVNAAAGCTAVNDGGFAIAATDMGHQGQGSDFGQDPAKRADFAYRAQHLTAVAAKKLIRSFYGRGATYAYFNGCSDGGREALVEAQRYPEDFNGIIAGAPALNFQIQNGLYHAWQARANTGTDGKAILVAARLPILHQAVLKQCDALDGLEDGLISDPRACHFDPASVQCKPGQATTACLSAEEVAAARRLYDGPHDPGTGARLTIGGPQPGSELNWAGVFVPTDKSGKVFSDMIAQQALTDIVFPPKTKHPTQAADMSFDRATFDRLRTLHPLYDATNPDLSAFAISGSKLILWHGWADPHISPLNTIAYQEALESTLGKERTAGFERLYLLPGVGHCGGGEGPSLLDLMTPLMGWVELGHAPDEVLTQQEDPARRPRPGMGQGQGPMPDGKRGPPPGGAMKPGAEGTPPDAAHAGPPPDMAHAPGATPMVPNASTFVARSRPVFPYPEMAQYKSGSPNEASSFVRAPALYTGKTPDWLGKDLFTPYAGER